jgi:hypothetical protein
MEMFDRERTPFHLEQVVANMGVQRVQRSTVGGSAFLDFQPL